MTPFHLHNKLILVTGATSGIGREIAQKIVEMGGKIVLTGRNATKLNELKDLLGDAVEQIFAVDLLDIENRNKFIKELPILNGIVHSAGVVNPFPIRFIEQEKIDETLQINYEVPLLLMSSLLRMKKIAKDASIVFLSSISGQHPHKGGALYAGSKAAIEALSKTIALENYHRGMRSNCISPAMVKTEMYKEAEKDMSKEAMDEHADKYPLGVGHPEDVAYTAIFLLSDASKWITGINITLDGGFLLGI